MAHRLAAAIIYRLSGHTGELTISVRGLATIIPDLPPPLTIVEVAAIVEQVEGVRFNELLIALAGSALGKAQQALDSVLDMARTMPHDEVFDLPRHFGRWDPALSLLVAAAAGDESAGRAIALILDNYSTSTDWSALVAVLRRVLGGERDPDRLTAGLDPIDTAIVQRTLDALAGRITLEPPGLSEEWEAIVEGVALASLGNMEAAAAVAKMVEQLATQADWAALAAVLRRIINGERNTEQLLTGLDETDTAIVNAVLARLSANSTG